MNLKQTNISFKKKFVIYCYSCLFSENKNQICWDCHYFKKFLDLSDIGKLRFLLYIPRGVTKDPYLNGTLIYRLRVLYRSYRGSFFIVKSDLLGYCSNPNLLSYFPFFCDHIFGKVNLILLCICKFYQLFYFDK